MPGIISVVASTIAVAGCATVRPAPQAFSDAALCNAYASATGEYEDRIYAEIVERELIPDQYWEDVRANKVTAGMPECAVLAVSGRTSVNALEARRDRIRSDSTREPSFSDRFGSGVPRATTVK